MSQQQPGYALPYVDALTSLDDEHSRRERELARKVIARMARDADDEQLLLRALGLVDDPDAGRHIDAWGQRKRPGHRTVEVAS